MVLGYERFPLIVIPGNRPLPGCPECTDRGFTGRDFHPACGIFSSVICSLYSERALSFILTANNSKEVYGIRFPDTH